MRHLDMSGSNISTAQNSGVITLIDNSSFQKISGSETTNINGDIDLSNSNVSGKNMDILRGVAGVRASKDFYLPNSRYVRPEAYLGAIYDFVSDRDNAYVSLSNGSGYMVHGKRLNRFGVEAAAGVTFEINDNLKASANYLGTYRKDYQDHTAMIGMQYNF